MSFACFFAFITKYIVIRGYPGGHWMSRKSRF